MPGSGGAGLRLRVPGTPYPIRPHLAKDLRFWDPPPQTHSRQLGAHSRPGRPQGRASRSACWPQPRAQGAADDAGTVEPAQVRSDDSSSDSRLQRDCARLQRLLHEKKGLQREVARVWPMTCSPLSQRPRAQASQQEQGHHTAKGPEGTASGSTASFSGTGPQGPSATGGHTRGPNTTK